MRAQLGRLTAAYFFAGVKWLQPFRLISEMFGTSQQKDDVLLDHMLQQAKKSSSM